MIGYRFTVVQSVFGGGLREARAWVWMKFEESLRWVWVRVEVWGNVEVWLRFWFGLGLKFGERLSSGKV